MKILFNDIPAINIANGQGRICRYPDSAAHFITIDVMDLDTGQPAGCMDLDVEEAIELRDWLNAAIPSTDNTEAK